MRLLPVDAASGEGLARLDEQHLLESYGNLLWQLSNAESSRHRQPPNVYVVSLAPSRPSSGNAAAARQQLLYTNEVALMKQLQSVTYGRESKTVAAMLQHAKHVHIHARLVRNYMREYRRRCRLDDKQHNALLDQMKACLLSAGQ